MILLLLSKLFKKHPTPEESLQRHSELLDAEISLQESESALERAKATVEFNKARVARLHRQYDVT